MFAVGGAEALAFLRNDVKGGMRTILGVLALVRLTQVLFYGVGTGAMLAILSPAAATRLSGLPDALSLALLAARPGSVFAGGAWRRFRVPAGEL